MKVCVVTYCTWRSYGSVLQSLGLRHALDKIGCESFVLQQTGYSKMRKARLLAKNAADVRDFFIRGKVKENCRRGNEFIDENINIQYFDSYEALCKNVPTADAYLAGSDQIWHPGLCNPAFFLDFVPDGRRRISYAASMGDCRVPTDKEKLFSQLLGGIDCLSVREKENAAVIEKYTDKPISVNIDPTFFCSRDFWRAHEKPYDIKGKYILVYAIYWDKSLNSQLQSLHMSTGLPIVAVSGHCQKVYANKRIFDAGPAEFLWLADNAEYVVTSSFHGAALSAILGKQFSVVINPSSPSRLKNLTEALGIPEIPIASLSSSEAIDYSAVEKSIAREQKKGFDYLRGALGLPRTEEHE